MILIHRKIMEEITMRTESKADGFRFEEEIIKRYDLTPSDNYTHRWDAFASDGAPVSIKTAGIKNEIIFGNLFRQASIKEPYFYLIVGIWNDTPDIIEDVYMFKLYTSTWHSLFSRDGVIDVMKLMKMAKSGYFEDSNINEWHSLRERISNEWAESTPNILRLRLRYFDNSSKGDKDIFRPQCAIRTSTFIDKFVNNDKLKHVKSGPVILKTKTTKVTERKVTEDTEYGKKITEETITEVIETESIEPINLFDIANIDIDNE